MERIKYSNKELAKPVKVLSWAGVIYGTLSGSVPTVLVSAVGVYAANRMERSTSK